MKIWLDAHLAPRLAEWLSSEFAVEAVSLRDLGLRSAKDLEIFAAAGQNNAVVMTKDGDFKDLVLRRGPPPQVIWITCGNTSNARLRTVLTSTFRTAQRLLESGEPIVEISDVG